MSIHSEVVCDLCNRRQKSLWNGEHHTAPEDWADLVTSIHGGFLDLHICFQCIDMMKDKRISISTDMKPLTMDEIKKYGIVDPESDEDENF